MPKAIFTTLLLFSSFVYPNFYSILLEEILPQDLSLNDSDSLPSNLDLIILKHSDSKTLAEVESKILLKYDLFRFTDVNHSNLVFLSPHNFCHFQVFHLDPKNFIIEAASEEIRNLLYIGYLPSLNTDQINYFKDALITTSPYLRKHITGDFINFDPFKNSRFELCVKREIEVSVEGDSKGNKSTKGELTFTSDDHKNKASFEFEYKENDKGEKEGRAKASLKTEF